MLAVELIADDPDYPVKVIAPSWRDGEAIGIRYGLTKIQAAALRDQIDAALNEAERQRRKAPGPESSPWLRQA